MSARKSGKAVATLSFILGISVSVAANVLHAAEGAWSPAELVGAGFWPLALLLAVEILTRVTWPVGKLWAVTRFGGVGIVAMVAAILSYRHMSGLLMAWEGDWLNAHIGPLAVDGLMILSTTALLAITKVRADARASASAPIETPATPVDTPKPVEPKQKKLHVVDSIPETADEDHARQLWMASGGTMSGQKIADMLGKSRSSGYRLVQTWKEEATG